MMADRMLWMAIVWVVAAFAVGALCRWVVMRLRARALRRRFPPCRYIATGNIKILDGGAPYERVIMVLRK